MTVKIDQSNSNPATCCTYHDDAEGMTAGSEAWDEFFGHYPCLFKEGQEVGKLNRNDFTKFEDGTTADITSGNAGDVMIAFPRRGLKISTNGNIVTISMTNNPNDPNFEYYAHTRGTTAKDVFYLGAYKGYVDTNDKLRSLSGKTMTYGYNDETYKSIDDFRTDARANGTGYDQSAFYQLIYRQAMYVLKYKDLNSQTAVGMGYVNTGNSRELKETGNADKKGMDYGESTGLEQMKLFGIEDVWGNQSEFVDGVFSSAERHILTATDNFNDTEEGYIDNGLAPIQGNQNPGFSDRIAGYMSKIQGTTETGFIGKENTGSSTTFFCDYISLLPNKLCTMGGGSNGKTNAGIFNLQLSSDKTTRIYNTSRLMYL